MSEQAEALEMMTDDLAQAIHLLTEALPYLPPRLAGYVRLFLADESIGRTDR